MRAQLAALVGLLVPGSLAHNFFPNFIANGNYTGYYEYVRDNDQNYMPTKGGYDSTDFRCRAGSQAHAADTSVYKVKAGDTIGFGAAFNAVLAHPGPLQVYMSKAPGDVHAYDGSGDWFKIYELGPKAFSSDGIEWGATGGTNFTFPLPEETPAGQYLVRIEYIGVHGAGDYGGAEFYFNCAQIEVESDSTAVPGPLVKIPGLYTGYEPGILFYMYRPWIVNYTMPGPALWPNPSRLNITASGVSVAPTETPWTLPAVTPDATTSDSTETETSQASSQSVSTSLAADSSVPGSVTSTAQQTTSTSKTVDATSPTSTSSKSTSRRRKCPSAKTVYETVTITK